jgi:nucleotide-binding universal stress UspA family protein
MSTQFADRTRLSDTDGDIPDADSGGSFRRVLVPIDPLGESAMDSLDLATRIGTTTGGPLRVVCVRMWDPPVARSPGRFYLQTSEAVTELLATALRLVWDRGVEATGIVVDAERSKIATAIVGEAAAWDADVIVMTQEPRRFFTRGLWDKVSTQVMRATDRPVMVVHPTHTL